MTRATGVPPPPAGGGRGTHEHLLWNPVLLGGTAGARLSPEHGGSDHLIAGSVTTAAKFPAFQPTQSATPRTSQGKEGGPIRMASFTQAHTKYLSVDWWVSR